MVKAELMFRLQGRRLQTYNPITGCLHNCRYCYARHLVETRLRHLLPHKYGKCGFQPTLHPHELRRHLPPNTLVFVSDLGDMFGDWVRREWIEAVLSHLSRFPHTRFLLLTKNPRRFHEFLHQIPDNCILAVTAETDDEELYHRQRISHAPPPLQRLRELRQTGWRWRAVSVEPVIRFADVEGFADHIAKALERAEEAVVWVGYDNYHRRNHLPEPHPNDVRRLVHLLRNAGLHVEVKRDRRGLWRAVEG